ncbi:MAG: CBS domain-containing protein, partial [Proteobacteria bacterium]|nr:CBS domain-containing protein [Pseudomonadota bacterium]
DSLPRVSLEYAEARARPLREFMTPDPGVVYEAVRPARVLNLMAAGGFRHLPVVDPDGKLTGMIGCRRVTDYLQQHLAPSSA